MWKDIKIENIRPVYQINEFGEVRNKRTGRKLKPREKNGYLEYALVTVDNKYKYIRAHRLVAIHFIPISEYDKMEVNHKDADKKNNHVSNLEWVTSEENLDHARKLGLLSYKGSKNPFSKYDENLIENICILLSKGFDYDEIIEKLCLEDTKNIRKLIIKIKNRETWVHISKKYEWDENEPWIRVNDKYKEFKKKIIKLIRQGRCDKEIMEIMGWNLLKGKEKEKKKDFIKRLRRKIEKIG